MIQYSIFWPLLVWLILPKGMESEKRSQAECLPFSGSTRNEKVFTSEHVRNPLTDKWISNEFETEVSETCRLIVEDLVALPIYLKNSEAYKLIYKMYRTYFDKYFPERGGLTGCNLPMQTDTQLKAPKQIVEQFLKEVRSGLHPERAGSFMADTILAHQLNSENPVTIKRTPANYTEHVKSFISMFGKFEFEVTELLAEGDKVYVRWKQTGQHLMEMDGYKATGLPLIEFTSVVYSVKNGKIVEYWLQTDRQGYEEQLKRNREI